VGPSFASDCHSAEEKKPPKPTRFPHAGFANWNIHKNTDHQQMGYTRNTWFNVFNEQCQFVATVSASVVLADLLGHRTPPENAALDTARACNPAQLRVLISGVLQSDKVGPPR